MGFDKPWPFIYAARRSATTPQSPKRCATKGLLGPGWGKRGHDFRIGAVPNTQNTVMATGDDDLAIWRDRGGVHEIGPTFEGADFFAAVTDRSNLVVAGGSQCLVRDTDETDGSHFLSETFNGFLPLTGHKVTHLNHVIGAGTGQRPSIPFPTDAEHVMRMAFKRPHDFAGRQIQNFDKFIRRTGGQVFSVG